MLFTTTKEAIYYLKKIGKARIGVEFSTIEEFLNLTVKKKEGKVDHEGIKNMGLYQ